MEPLIELKCRNCGAALTPADISPQLAAARCQHCHALFALPTAAAPAPPRPMVELPKSFRFERSAGGIRIHRRWFTPLAFFLLFFAILWNGFVLVWNGIALSSGMWPMALFGLLHTGVGLFLIYYVVALFVNTTVIEAVDGQLKIQSGPLPWKGNLTLPTAEITQLFCREKITHGKNGPRTSYQLEAVLAGNRRRVVLSGLPESEHAVFIEQQLEHHLKIPDSPVSGEHHR